MSPLRRASTVVAALAVAITGAAVLAPISAAGEGSAAVAGHESPTVPTVDDSWLVEGPKPFLYSDDENCGSCVGCSTGFPNAKYTWFAPPGSGDGYKFEDAESCPDCSHSGLPLCRAEASIRSDAPLRTKLAQSLGPNEIDVVRTPIGTEVVLGRVSLDLAPDGMSHGTFVDLMVASEPVLCDLGPVHITENN